MTSLTLRLDSCSVSRHAVHGRYSLGEMLFNTSIWYDAVDFDLLKEIYGADAIERIAFHIAAFEAMKLVAFRPKAIDWGAGSGYVDDAFARIWREIYHNVWAQWRFETGNWDYAGPEFAADAPPGAPLQLHAPSPAAANTLLFHGGGKDSLLAAQLLTEIEEPFDTLTYAASAYGPMALQHGLIDRTEVPGLHGRRYRQWIADDFSSIPVAELRPDLLSGPMISAETPSTLFSAIPYSLQYGYRSLCFAHERSADTPQAFSPSGAPINHQWGKSSEAEKLQDDYIRQSLVRAISSFSLLKPIHDVAIFGLLRRWEKLVPLAHSCNIAKPWCLHCPKCLYVWLGYAAFFERETVVQTFGAINPLQDEANIDTVRAMIGLGEHLPFECIGEAGETALYVSMCQQRGYTGPVITACDEALRRTDRIAEVAKYLAVHPFRSGLPADMVGRLSIIFGREATGIANFIL